MPVEVRYADDTLLVVDKPSGLLSVPGRGPANADCVSARVQAEYPDALVVHRLDMGTSGLMVLARGVEAQRRLSAQFAQRQVDKMYEALVAGIPIESASGGWSQIRLPLQVDWPNRPRSHVTFEGGKPSHTRWRLVGPPLTQHGDTRMIHSRVALQPLTGRSHQLRVHLLATGHPILGDELYAPPAIAQAATRLMLHAGALSFNHPVTGVRLSFTQPAPF